jgi:hypothetical protein
VQAAMGSINVKGMERLHLGIVWARREDKECGLCEITIAKYIVVE